MTKLETGSKYNIPLMNSLVLYVGVKAINLMHSNRHTPTQTTIAQGAHMDIFQNLAVDLDNEGGFLSSVLRNSSKTYQFHRVFATNTGL